MPVNRDSADRFMTMVKSYTNKEIICKNCRRLFFINNLDAHYNIELFKTIKIQIKNNKKFDYKEVSEYGLSVTKRTPRLIVSLTSYPERIPTVYKTINTLLNQTIKPDKLILWLAESQFKNKEQDLPDSLLSLKEYGLEVKFCSEDIGSYKKLVPALIEYPEDIIVTADDDLYYQKDWLESLYNEYLQNPDYIYARRASKIYVKDHVLKISSHYSNKYYKPTSLCQFLGGAGTLFPPHSLHKDIFNTEKIKNLIPTHDDIYFWAMAVLNGKKIKLVRAKDVNLLTIEGTQKSGLCKKNRKNNVGISPLDAYKRIINEYPELYDKLEEEINKYA